MIIQRRKLLLGAAAGICAPAIVRAQTLNTLGAGSAANVSAAVATTFDPAKIGPNIVLSNGNLTATGAGGTGDYQLAIATSSHNTGKYYFEMTLLTQDTYHAFGGVDSTAVPANSFGSQTGPQFRVDFRASQSGSGNGITLTADYVAATTMTVNDVCGIAIDFTAGKIWASKNGDFTAYSTLADPPSGAHPLFTFAGGSMALFPTAGILAVSDSPATLLAAHGTFANAPPTGFSSWS